jgi:hypothetical protein
VVAHPAVDAAMKAFLFLTVLILVLSGAAVLAPGVGSASPGFAPAAAPATSPVTNLTGNISGASVVGTSTNDSYFINGTGGPAYLNGEHVGNITWYASVSGTVNSSIVTLVPTSNTLMNYTPGIVTVEVGGLVQTLTLTVELASKNATTNETTNLTQIIHVVQPYLLTLHLHVSSIAAIHEFNLTIDLDGVPVGRIHIPPLAAGTNTTAEFLYATLGLSPGTHTFTASLIAEHGLVTFAGGATTMSVSFFVPGAPPSYTVWYVAGIVAFFGALFIIVTRVAARRRPVAKK